MMQWVICLSETYRSNIKNVHAQSSKYIEDQIEALPRNFNRTRPRAKPVTVSGEDITGGLNRCQSMCL